MVEPVEKPNFALVEPVGGQNKVETDMHQKKAKHIRLYNSILDYLKNLGLEKYPGLYIPLVKVMFDYWSAGIIRKYLDDTRDEKTTKQAPHSSQAVLQPMNTTKRTGSPQMECNVVTARDPFAQRQTNRDHQEDELCQFSRRLIPLEKN